MKKPLHFFLAFAGLLFFGTAKAQTYSAWGDPGTGSEYAVIDVYDDTLTFTFSGLPATAYGTAHLDIHFSGDFGDPGEFATAYFPGMVALGSTEPNMFDCSPEDSTMLPFDATVVGTWGGNVTIKVIISSNVDVFNCEELGRIRLRLVYDYCAAGTPDAFAAFTLADDIVCLSDDAQALTGTPAGGTFTGTGVSGSTFNPAGLMPGTYTITYTATDLIGCVTSATQDVRIMGNPADIDVLLCRGDEPTVAPGGPSYAFSTMENMSTLLGTDAAYTFPAVLNSPTVYYFAKQDLNNYFALDTITNDNAFVIEHGDLSGDDRGGIAITDSMVYVVGDDYTARFPIDLLGPGVSLPRRDGIFTDLRQKKIYSLYSTVNNQMPDDYPSDFAFNAIIALDADLQPTSEIIELSQTITLGSNFSNTGIFAGYGELVVYSGNNENVYAIDLDFGNVTELGTHSLNLYGSENWADWGVAGFDGTDYTIYYRDYMFEQIVAHNLTTDAVTPVSAFSDVSDLSSFVIDPTNNRLYFHHEYDAQFGGEDETLGYIDATDSVGILSTGNTVGCPAPITFTFNSVNLGPDTTVCSEGIYMLQAGLGYQSYTWNGVNNNWNVYPVQTGGQYVVEVVDAINCVLTDTVVVTVDPNCVTGIEEQTLAALTAYPVPNNGSFGLAFGQSLNNAAITLVNTQGVVCHHVQLDGSQQTAQIKASGLAPGVYFVRITSDEGMQQLPVIVE